MSLFNPKGKRLLDAYLKNYRESKIPKTPRKKSHTGGYRGGLAVGGNTGEHWSGSLNAIPYTTFLNNYGSRRRARHAVFDQPAANTLVKRRSDIVINTGLTIQPTPDWKIIGINQEDAQEWAKTVEKSFHNWAKSKLVSIDEINNFYQLQRCAFTGQIRDGEYLARFFYSKNKSLQNPLQLQLIDPERLQGAGIVGLVGDNAAYSCGDGITRDKNGKEIGYKITTYNHRTQKTEIVDLPARGPKSGRVFVIHGYRQIFPGQGRGLSEIFTSLQWLQKITDLSDAELQKAIVNASIALYVKPSEDGPASNPIPMQRTSSFEDEAEAVIDETSGCNVDFQNIGNDVFRKPGVGVFSLNGGEDLKAFEFDRNGTDFATFQNSIIEIIAAEADMPVEVLLMKFSKNYSASRAAIVLAWQIARQWRMEIETDFLNIVYEMWLSGEIAAGRIAAPGWSDPRLKSAWSNVRWIGIPIPSIDPFKEAKATGENIKMGLTTRERAARNLNGSSYDDNVEKLKEENKKMREAREAGMNMELLNTKQEVPDNGGTSNN